MTIRWQQLLVSLVLWLIAEIFLNLAGIDDLADYSEYLFDRHAVAVGVGTQLILSPRHAQTWKWVNS
ncbi:hypothetical protein [Acaryochloris sp. IP29b_bin.137]|uniref:hypothetical protein n=1 Tax=Acaryochloris sp. IP29b_bin.137 TaxID=2969217 RepID=UPI002639679D|nr:hypothetical protein [Acaryochloris sp. IP29b_bin.137]